MKSTMRAIAAAAALTCVAATANAAVLNFDNRAGLQPFVGTYAGPDGNQFVFTYVPGPAPCSACAGSWYTSDAPDPFAQPGFSPLYKSPFTTASTDDGNNGQSAPVYGESQPIFATAPIVFDGAWFTSNDNVTVAFHLSLNNVEVHVTPYLSLTYGAAPVFLSSGYTGQVNKITVEGYQGYFNMDDFTYNTAAIPEPSTYALMMLGLGVVGLSAARRSKKAG